MKGQVQVEAIICLAIFLGLLGQAMAAMQILGKLSEDAAVSVNEKMDAETCCLIADTVYSTGTIITGKTLKCETTGRTAASGSKKCTALSSEIRLVQSGEKTAMEVFTNEHYR